MSILTQKFNQNQKVWTTWKFSSNLFDLSGMCPWFLTRLEWINNNNNNNNFAQILKKFPKYFRNMKLGGETRTYLPTLI